MAYQAARSDQPADAVTLVDTAVAGTKGQQTPKLLAALYPKQAYAFATLRDAPACTAAISKARTHVEQSAHEDDPPYLYWVRPAEVLSGAGRCLQKLGQADRAADMLGQGLALFGAPFDRDRTNYLIHLAEAFAQPGKQRDLHAAANTGMQAIDLAEALSSTRTVDRIRVLARQLTPHATVAPVRDFLDRTRTFTAAQA